MDNKKVARKKVAHFFCDKCDYSTFKTSSWKKHLETIKHKRITRITKKLLKKPPSNNESKYVCPCGKKYKYCSGLSKHKNRCKFSNISNTTKKKNTYSYNRKKRTMNTVFFVQTFLYISILDIFEMSKIDFFK